MDLGGTQDIVVSGFRTKKRIFSAGSQSYKVVQMSNFGGNDRFEGRNQETSPAEGLTADQDLLMEQILDNINTTPIGRVLKRIASLPEVRKEKVLDVRQQLSRGKYRVNERLDVALDRVLEDLTT
jgi:hypothetical protein